MYSIKMKTALILFIALFIGVSLHADTQAEPFKSASFEQVKLQAIQQQKPIMVFFYTQDCKMCNSMRKYAFKNKELLSYLKENYLSFQSNGEGPGTGGRLLAQSHGVNTFPTILILGPDDIERARVGGYKMASELMPVLKEKAGTAEEYANASSDGGTVLPASHNAMDQVYRRYPQPGATMRKLPNARSAGSTEVSEAPNSPAMAFDILPKGSYAVQIGLFAEFPNAQREVKRVEALGYDAAIVHTFREGEDMFKVILGPLETRAEADEYKKDMREDGIKAFVVMIL